MIHLNPEDATLSQHVIAIAEDLYGERPRLRKFHSQVSYVCALAFDTLSPKVIKLERNEPDLIALEVQRLRALGALGLPVPAVEFTSEDLPGSTTPFFVMPLAATLRLGDLIWASRPSAPSACRRAGAFLRQLHQHTDWEVPAGIIGTVEIPDFVALTPRLAPPTVAKLELLVQAVQALLDETPHALCHGQLHTENVVADDTGAFCVVDWDSFCVGSIWADVALFLRTVREWNNGTEEHRHAFWEGLDANEADHSHAVRIWTLFEAATSLDWQLGEGFVVEPTKLDDFSHTIAHVV